MTDTWTSVLSNSLVAVYRADQADPTWRRTREVVMLETEAHGGTTEHAERAITIWTQRGCLVPVGTDWRITDQGRNEARRLIKARRVSGDLLAS